MNSYTEQKIKFFEEFLPFDDAKLKEAFEYYEKYYDEHVYKLATILDYYKVGGEELWEMDMISAINCEIIKDGLLLLENYIPNLRSRVHIKFEYLENHNINEAEVILRSDPTLLSEQLKEQFWLIYKGKRLPLNDIELKVMDLIMNKINESEAI